PSSCRVNTRLDTVEPWVMALVSSCRNVSLSGWPPTTDTGKSPAGTSGVGMAPGGASGGAPGTGGVTVPTCSCQYQDPPLTGTPALVSERATVGNRHVATAAATTNVPQRRVSRLTPTPAPRGIRPKRTAAGSDLPGRSRVEEGAEVAGTE